MECPSWEAAGLAGAAISYTSVSGRLGCGRPVPLCAGLDAGVCGLHALPSCHVYTDIHARCPIEPRCGLCASGSFPCMRLGLHRGLLFKSHCPGASGPFRHIQKPGTGPIAVPFRQYKLRGSQSHSPSLWHYTGDGYPAVNRYWKVGHVEPLCVHDQGNEGVITRLSCYFCMWYCSATCLCTHSGLCNR